MVFAAKKATKTESRAKIVFGLTCSKSLQVVPVVQVVGTKKRGGLLAGCYWPFAWRLR